MGTFLVVVGTLLLFLGLPASVIFLIVKAIKRKPFKNVLISIAFCFFGSIIIIGVGGSMLPDDKTNEQETKIHSEEQELGQIQEHQAEESEKEEVATEDEAEKELKDELQKELTVDEYKSLCVDIYNDDVFKRTIDNGTKVKIYVMISEKYDYSPSSMQGILVEDITDEYNLETNCLGCTVMHESTKNDSVPSYFGKQIYIMFQKGSALNIDIFKTGQKFIIYGEIIQNTNGHYILPKYYEEG